MPGSIAVYLTCIRIHVIDEGIPYGIDIFSTDGKGHHTGVVRHCWYGIHSADSVFHTTNKSCSRQDPQSPLFIEFHVLKEMPFKFFG